MILRTAFAGFLVILLGLCPRVLFAQYAGGTGDGFARSAVCANDLNGSSPSVISFNPISGTTSFCAFSTESFSVTLASGFADSFDWSLPPGSSIINRLQTSTSSIVVIQFGNTDGSISVTAENSCQSVTSSAMIVTSIACSNFSGGMADGVAFINFCAADLDGLSSPAISLSAITGPGSFCSNTTELYSVSVITGSATTYFWSSGSASVTSQNANSFFGSAVNLLMGNADGTLTVEVTDGCTSASQALPITAVSCGQAQGGNGDGFVLGSFCASDLDGGTLPAIVLNPLVGPSDFCNFSNEGYSISLTSGIADSYYWTGPTGTTVLTQQDNLTAGMVNLLMGNASGNISVEVKNSCTLASATLPVTGVPCLAYNGGNDDGFSSSIFCSLSLNGGALAPITLNPIAGNSNVFFNLGQNFSVTLATGNATIYNWTGPPGANSPAQISTPTSSIALLNIASAGGNVTVEASNGCSTAQAVLAVTGQISPAYFGGVSDGFALPVELTSFTAEVVNQEVELRWVTASELNNDYFVVERSGNGEMFDSIGYVRGSGTTGLESTYSYTDRNPWIGRAYYRLRQVDFDKQFQYSDVLAVRVTSTEGVKIYPNPSARQPLLFEFKRPPQATFVLIEGFDSVGKRVMRATIDRGDRFTLTAENGLPKTPGVYIFRVTMGTLVVNEKIIIQ